MSTQILSFDLTPFYIQSGYGIPDHFSTLGSEYTDLYTALKYVNKNGLDYWVEMGNGSGGGSFTGGTITGPSYFTNGLTATTISATTYLNLPSSGGSFTGGTVSGDTIFTGGLTANTLSVGNINPVDYIVFNTGTTSATTVPGTVYFDNTEKALSYNTSLNQGVTVNLGQQNYLRVFNNSGLDIPKGKCVELLSSYSGLPAIQLAVNRHLNDRDVVGVSAEIIPNNSEGIILTYGIISNITVTGASIGSLVYASDTNPGEFKNALEFNNFPLTARTNAVGYIIQTGTTTGKLFVNPVNENNNLSLTDLQRNILEGNAISTGVFSFGGISLASSSTFNVGPAEGWIVDNTTDPLVPDVFYVKYSGQTNIPSLYYSSATETYLLLTSAATLTQLVTFPTPQQRRQGIYLGKMGHGNRTSLINAFNEPDFEISPISQIRDMFTPIKLINENVYPSPNSNLTFNTSSGTLWGLGIGFATNQLNPSSITVSGNSPTTFQYRTQTGGTATNRTTIDPANYDLNGLITSIGTPAKQATNQRIFLLQNGQIRIQYGQTKYTDLTAAIAAVTTEAFTTFSNFRDNAVLIAILSVRSDATILTNTLQAKITFASKFGESVGGTGGISTTNLQQAYNNSATPEIVTNSAEGALSIKNGTGNADNVTSLIEGINTAGNATSFIRADGVFSGTTFYAPTLYSSSINNTGTGGLTITGNQSLSLVQGNQNVGFISIGTSSSPSVAYNDGRTITSTRFIGNPTPLSGSNWNYNQIAIETVVNIANNSTGKFRGIYINPSLTMTGNNEYFAIEVVTGKTILDTLSATTISATTYQNLPIKYYAEFSAAPVTSPIVSASNSIAIGDGAQAKGVHTFVLGQYAGLNTTTATTYSTFIGNNAGNGATNVTNSNFFGGAAGNGSTNASNSNFMGSGAGMNSTGASNSNFFGQNSGKQANNANNSNFMGQNAGTFSTNANDSNFMGNQAGNTASGASLSNFFGFQAGKGATNASNSNFFGNSAGLNATGAAGSNFFGASAGNGASSANNSNFIGNNAGNGATSASNSNFLGTSAGINAKSASQSNFFGNNAGGTATGATGSNFFGQQAGNTATNAAYSNFIGTDAGNTATNASDSNFLGNQSGYLSSGASKSNFLGYSAGKQALNATQSNFFGYQAGNGASNASSSNFIGYAAGEIATSASSSNFIGYQAGNGAKNASVSNFMGSQVGFNATGASFSNFFGYRAGYAAVGSVGTNNIIIGTNISLPSATTNSINIGAVLFGTGTYGTPSGNPLITPSNGKIGINVVTPLEALHVSGRTLINGGLTANTALFSASTQNVLRVIGSGSSTTPPIFSVQGSQGELFSVTDSLIGSLFSVNDISGLPILEVFSDDTVLMGSYLAPSLNTTEKITAGIGLTNIYSIPTSTYTGAFFDYTVSNNINLRAGNIMAIWNTGTTVQYTETSTNDIGNTSGLTFNIIISGSSAILRASGVTGNWTVKTIIRSI